MMFMISENHPIRKVTTVTGSAVSDQPEPSPQPIAREAGPSAKDPTTRRKMPTTRVSFKV